MISKKIGIDDIDCRIMELIQNEPNLTHTQIATQVNRSQPTVGMRIRKLEKLGVLKYQAGINIKAADLCFVRVELQTKNPKKTIQKIKNCSFMINAFKVSGKANLSILMVGEDYKFLDSIVNNNFRNDPEVLKVHMDIIEDVVNDFVAPLADFGSKDHCCGECKCDTHFLCSQ